MHLSDGFGSAVSLRRYRPQGMRLIRELSVYPTARSSARVLISTATDGCIRLRVPAWEGRQVAGAQAAQVHIDIR